MNLMIYTTSHNISQFVLNGCATNLYLVSCTLHLCVLLLFSSFTSQCTSLCGIGICICIPIYIQNINSSMQNNTTLLQTKFLQKWILFQCFDSIFFFHWKFLVNLKTVKQTHHYRILHYITIIYNR